MNIIRNLIKKDIGVFYLTKEWARDVEEALLSYVDNEEDVPFWNRSIYRTGSYTSLHDGTNITFIDLNKVDDENYKDLEFDLILVEDGLSMEQYCEALAHQGFNYNEPVIVDTQGRMISRRYYERNKITK